jgi:signal transduction histidine kinase
VAAVDRVDSGPDGRSGATAARSAHGLSLRQRVGLVAAAAVLLATLASVLASRTLIVSQLVEAQQDHGKTVAQGLAIQLQRILALGLRIDEVQGFEAQCRETLAAHADVAYVVVLLLEGRVLAQDAQPGVLLPEPQALAQALAQAGERAVALPDGSRPVAVQVKDLAGSPVAQIVVGFPQALLDDAASRLLRTHLAAGGAALALTLLLLWWAMSRWVTRPLARIVERMNAIDPRRAATVAAVDDRTVGPPDPDLASIDDAVARLLARLSEHEAELVTTRDQALEASRLKSEFLSVMSHEVRTPLNAVLGMAQLLETTSLNAQQRAWLGHLQHGGETLLAMVTDILDLASIEAGRLHLHPEPTDLGAVVREVADLHSALALAKNLQLETRLDTQLPRAAWVDRHRLRQVLGNLLSNAIKFTAQGRVQVDAALQADGAGWTLTVSDTGPGIPEAFRPHLYESFRQGTEGTARRHGGTGLGLAIVHRLLRAMGGSITCESQPGRGTTFVVGLPLQAPPTAPPTPPQATGTTASGSPAP